VGTKEELSQLVRVHNLERYGKLASMYIPFLPGRLNKFGIPFLDDVSLINYGGDSHTMMFGNMHIVNRVLNNQSGGLDYLNSLKHVLFSPKTWWLVHKHIGLRNAARRFKDKRFPISDIEEIVSTAVQDKGYGDYVFKMIHAPPEAILDIDTWKDFERNNALIAKREVYF
jgi:hypothetical protein